MPGRMRRYPVTRRYGRQRGPVAPEQPVPAAAPSNEGYFRRLYNTAKSWSPVIRGTAVAGTLAGAVSSSPLIAAAGNYLVPVNDMYMAYDALTLPVTGSKLLTGMSAGNALYHTGKAAAAYASLNPILAAAHTAAALAHATRVGREAYKMRYGKGRRVFINGRWVWVRATRRRGRNAAPVYRKKKYY